MKLNTLITRIPAYYAAGISLYAKSAPGRGKTHTISRAPAILANLYPGKSFGFVTRNGAGLEVQEATGYLMPVQREGERPRAEFTRPDWWFTVEGKPLEAYDGGIIFIDEMDKAPVDVKKLLGEAAESGVLASHKLPPGWVVWGAGNRQGDRSGSTKELDHLINRRMEIDIDDDLGSLVEWMEQNGALPETIMFANENPQIVFTPGVPTSQGPWCTPRALMKADTYLQVLSQSMNGGNDLPTDSTTIEEFGGIIGHAAAAQYFAMVRLGMELPSYEEIVAKPATAKLPKRADAQMLSVYKLSARVTKEDARAVITYMDRLPKEFAVTFMRATCIRTPSFITLKPVAEWCGKNASLVAVLGKLMATK